MCINLFKNDKECQFYSLKKVEDDKNIKRICSIESINNG